MPEHASADGAPSAPESNYELNIGDTHLRASIPLSVQLVLSSAVLVGAALGGAALLFIGAADWRRANAGDDHEAPEQGA
ncbi:hypothetical protein OG357_16635 [Streptomyces sp. NBC_01255]|uniref:hypothetical protein n=1 Tax=Streptomyces sp. NBC_01255 TaxID=2903798 RepID=UPI002E30D3E7|nr:hypothetical protein [Streptomyces sp. NBC_01255]